MSANKLIGIYGGAFDPIHNAHIEIAKKCIDVINLNKLILIPTGRSAFKKPLTVPKHRLAMLNLAFNGPKYEISKIEIDKSENTENPSYSFDTLKYFFNRDKNIYFFIIGTDALANFYQWYKWKEILSLCHILLINRSDDDIFSQNWHPVIKELIEANWTNQIDNLKSNRAGMIFSVTMPRINIASHSIKDDIHNKKSLQSLVPLQIENYIKENSLY
ncbi:nicotinate (nicotinamide) nucleotide adenylyltransferase [Methylophilaceae bacterium]|jgi:nicotinate-nucleotide adenylyltransferase|nr:nicotinate (nicotinamide) nucleotide adenylyltransferase [Methylophilaceae bacterium]